MTVTQIVRRMASAVLIMRIFVEKVSLMVPTRVSLHLSMPQTCTPALVSLIMSNVHST